MTRFSLRHQWQGNTNEDPISKDARASAPGKEDLLLSTTSAHGGDDHRWNPEDTLGAALAQCHTLTFLALAKKAGVDVRAVDTEVDVFLETVDRVPEVTRCELRSTLQIGPEANAAKALEMYGKAHRYCYVARSLKGEVHAEATITPQGDGEDTPSP